MQKVPLFIYYVQKEIVAFFLRPGNKQYLRGPARQTKANFYNGITIVTDLHIELQQ